MWVETSGDHVLGIHLGMSGRILVTERGGGVDEGGDYVGTRPQRTPIKPEWDRFTLHFAGGGALRLFDKRRLGRVRLDPDIEALGPDAGEVRLADFRTLVGASRTPVKARLLDKLMFRHWNAWKDGKRSHVFVVPAEGGTPKDLTPGDAER